jgi:hypothetical protein
MQCSNLIKLENNNCQIVSAPDLAFSKIVEEKKTPEYVYLYGVSAEKYRREVVF